MEEQGILWKPASKNELDDNDSIDEYGDIFSAPEVSSREVENKQVVQLIADKLKPPSSQNFEGEVISPVPEDDEDAVLEADEVTQHNAAKVPATGGAMAIEGPDDHALPPIENVILRRFPSSGTWKPLASQQNSAGPRTRTPVDYRPRDPQRDKLIGDRGEELVYRSEKERVVQLGYSADRVVWVSKNDPLADHDIRSVDDNGQDIWIEVKSTAGKDGRFEWSQAEFELALQARERYLIYRVYEVGTDHASVKCFRDPVALLLAKAMNIDIASLHAQVEPLSA